MRWRRRTVDEVRTPPAGRRPAGSPASGPIRCAASASTGGRTEEPATAPTSDHGVAVARTSLPPPSPVATAAVSTAIRRVVDDVSGELADPWRHRLRTVANSRRGDLDDALDRAVGTVRLPTDRPRWWRVAGAVQWLLAAALVVGLLWLLAIFVVAWFQLPDLPDRRRRRAAVADRAGPRRGGARSAARRDHPLGDAVGARRRASIARRRLVAATTDVGRELVIAPLDAELVAMTRLHHLVGELRR